MQDLPKIGRRIQDKKPAHVGKNQVRCSQSSVFVCRICDNHLVRHSRMTSALRSPTGDMLGSRQKFGTPCLSPFGSDDANAFLCYGKLSKLPIALEDETSCAISKRQRRVLYISSKGEFLCASPVSDLIYKLENRHPPLTDIELLTETGR
ncbi:hypothetical protein PoB_001390500 [Plakobranchus ocellatus]|uniref:Uncharacterized protein n=1 Tax=Plakobranchus ocellatus TaxID=259542 RepID=A0AAV3YY90_9GAST|nr:hypothetical protein PoB_001390500 [Plakobranchus ocellatus]